MTVRHDAIGRDYARKRREDPRLRACIHEALGEARSIVHVGAGAGSRGGQLGTPPWALRALAECDAGLRLIVGVP